MKTGKYRTTSITSVRDLSRLVRHFKVLVGRSQSRWDFSHYSNSCWGSSGGANQDVTYMRRGVGLSGDPLILDLVTSLAWQRQSHAVQYTSTRLKILRYIGVQQIQVNISSEF